MANYYSQQRFIHITEKNFLRQMEVHNKYIFFLSRSRSHYITLRKSTNIFFSHYTHHRRHIWCYGTVPQLFLFTFHLSPFSIGRYIIHKVAMYIFFLPSALTHVLATRQKQYLSSSTGEKGIFPLFSLIFLISLIRTTTQQPSHIQKCCNFHFAPDSVAITLISIRLDTLLAEIM